MKKYLKKIKAKKIIRGLLYLYTASTLIFFTSFLLIAYTPLGFLLAEPQIKSTPFAELADDAEAIVILGGDTQRAADAVKIFNAGKAKRIIISGDEAANLDVLLGAKIPQDKIAIDPLPLRTIDHPKTIQQHGIAPQTKIIITSTKLQERRAARLFREAGYTNFQIYSQTQEIYFPEMHKNKQSLSLGGAFHVFYSYAAWIKYWITD